MAISYVAAGTYSASGTADLTPGLPAGLADGDLLVLTVCAKYNDASIATPGGWTGNTAFTGGTGTSGNDVGTLIQKQFHREWTTGIGAPTITVSPKNVAQAVIIALRKGSTETWDVQTLGLGGGDAASSTTTLITSTNTFNPTVGSWLVAGLGYMGNNFTLPVTSRTIDFVNGTPGALTRTHRFEDNTSSGTDGALEIDTCEITSAGTATNVRSSTTTNLSTAGVGTFLWVKVTPGTTPIGKELQFLWNTRAAIGDTLELRWNTLENMTAIGKELQYLWHVRSVLAKDLQEVWNTAALATKSLEEIWNVRATVNDQLDARWNVLTPVFDTLEAPWHVRALAGEQRQFLWNTAALAGKSLDNRWNVSSVIGKETQYLWNTRALIGKETQYLWNTAAPVGKEIQYLWNTLATDITAIGKDLGLLWNVQALIAKNLETIWNVRATVSDEQQYLWNVRTVIGDEQQYLWNTRQAVGAERQLLWNLLANVPNQLDIRWNVNTVVSDELGLLWNVQSALGKEIQYLWNTQAAIGKETQFLWNVLTNAIQIGKNLDLLWHTRHIVRDITAYNLLTPWNLDFTSGVSFFEGGLNTLVENDNGALKLTRQNTTGAIVAMNFDAADISPLGSGQVVISMYAWASTATELYFWLYDTGNLSDNEAQWMVTTERRRYEWVQSFNAQGFEYLELGAWNSVPAGTQLWFDEIEVHYVDTTDLTLRWNTRKFTTKWFQMMWRVLTPVGKQLDTRWDMDSNAAKSLELLWNINAPSAKDLTLYWNTLRIQRAYARSADQFALNSINSSFDTNNGWAAKANTTISNVDGALRATAVANGFAEAINTPVSLPLAVGEHVLSMRVRTSGPNMAVYLQLVGTTNFLLDNSAQSAWSTVSMRINVGLPNTTISTINLGTNQAITAGQYIEVDWIEVTYLDDLSLSWNVNTFIGKQLDTRWGVGGYIGKELSTLWNVRQIVGADVDILNYNTTFDTSVAGWTGDGDVIWDATEQALKLMKGTATYPFAVNSLTSIPMRATGSRVKFRAKANQNTEAYINVYSNGALFFQQFTLTTQWQWFEFSYTTNGTILYQTEFGFMASPGATDYIMVDDIQFFQRYGPDLALLWNTLTKFNKDLTLRWNIFTFVGDFLNFRWHTRSALGKSLEIKWDTRYTHDWVDVEPAVPSWTDLTMDNDVWTPTVWDSDVWTQTVYGSTSWS